MWNGFVLTLHIGVKRYYTLAKSILKLIISSYVLTNKFWKKVIRDFPQFFAIVFFLCISKDIDTVDVQTSGREIFFSLKTCKNYNFFA